ncbi:hypothetical protein N7492_010263 [Penicillium capsulatum]|uniref:Uncharacterized protein n=1 Tax=Penicillium capsulatum TaxID=69766 RepID=A0A9W9HL21_9EURO|nr:hypothetical protein N7492_010263 [Penicillium capsulatum]KAJ6112770.1 hypothetical protein N7512_008094 [Penicillium capsulatum]
MAKTRESRYSPLEEEDLMSARPQNSWHPLGRSSPAPEYSTLPNTRPPSFSQPSRDVGLGISNAGDGIPRKRDSVSSTGSDPETPGFLKTPQTPGIAYSPTTCPSHSAVLQKRFGWVPVTIFVLALYATIMSGLFLAVAFWKPRWNTVGTDRQVSPSTAGLLSAGIAKTIELAYVPISVAFLGQVLSRRALMRDSRGISISDMSMRAWIMQPGSMIVHWETLRYSALTFLGCIALVASLVAMFYTTAAEALVSPKLNMSPMETTTIWGKVSASFGNSKYLAEDCHSPVPLSVDPEARNTTCLQMSHAGTAYHNYNQWITSWADLVTSGKQTSDQLRTRPLPTGSIWDNTTVTGSWIEIDDLEASSKKHNRMVNNITMAMPHGGVPAAAMDPKNNIRQPNEASGEGKYNMEASVPSPVVNVLCVGMSKEELTPLVYDEWPNSHFNATSYNSLLPDDIPRKPSWLNRTVVDPLFGFGEKYGQRPPVFGKLPEPNNTLVNASSLWPANAVYLLGKPAMAHPPYVMCSIRAKETGVCSTRYSAASSGAFLSSNCENKSSPLQFSKRQPDFIEGLWSSDWKDVATEWINSLSLGAGIADAQASNARLLMQLMPAYDASTKTYSLDPNVPSIGEALAVMAGSTLILSTRSSPFVQGWNYTGENSMLTEPVYQNFRASLQAVGYASGGSQDWQAVFYVILIFAFITSAVCLGFIIVEARGRQITDFTEPQNLFALALNSPPSSRLDGACGGGPVGRQMKERWYIGMEEDDAHYYIRGKLDNPASPYPRSGSTTTEYTRLRPEQMGVDDGKLSPAVSEFRRVSKRSSFFTRFY